MIGVARKIAVCWGFSGWFLARYEVWITEPAGPDKPGRFYMVSFFPASAQTRKFTRRQAVRCADGLKLPSNGSRAELVDLGSGRHTVLRECA